MVLCVCVSSVTAEMVRLSTENDYLKQEKEKLEDTSSKMSQKAASLVSQLTIIMIILYSCNSIPPVIFGLWKLSLGNYLVDGMGWGGGEVDLPISRIPEIYIHVHVHVYIYICVGNRVFGSCLIPASKRTNS